MVKEPDAAALAAKLKAENDMEPVSWWALFKASRAFKPVLIGVGLLAVVLLAFALGRCQPDKRGEAAQAQQTNRSGQAAAAAASNAIETLQQRTVTDAALDRAVDQATKDIDNAQTVDAVRDVVISSVCQNAAHRNDPACRVQPVNP